MKKIIGIILALAVIVSCVAVFAACKQDSIVVYTNAFFAPFEYYDGTDIVGVDVEIMAKVGEKMNKKVVIEDKDFGILIDTVSEGKLCDCAAAGITITDARKQKVAFSIPYYTSIQYVIYKVGDFTPATSADGTNTSCIYWSDLAGKKIGVQLDTTGDIYVGLEINGDHPIPEDNYVPDEEYTGELEGKGAVKTAFDTAQLAYEQLKAAQIDVVVVDELPAKYLVKNDSGYACAALYYDAETATSEQYAIAVNKDQTELLDAINAVLKEMLEDVDDEGNNGVIRLVAKHFGMNK